MKYPITFGLIVFTVAALVAANLTYSPFWPQTTDSELIISHKTAVNIAGIRTSIGEPTDGPGANSLIGQFKLLNNISPTPTATSTPTPTP